MSRSGYSEDCENINLYRGTVARSIRGKRGQAFLKELAAALDAMPDKKLITSELITEHGEVCAIGAVCKARGLNVSEVNEHESDEVGKLVNISQQMAAEIAFENDDEWGHYRDKTPEQRWQRMRKWVSENLIDDTATAQEQSKNAIEGDDEK